MLIVKLVLCTIISFNLKILYSNYFVNGNINFNIKIGIPSYGKSNLSEHVMNMFRMGPIAEESFIERDYIQGPKKILNEYDFIIVGAGPAGCVLANRLSKNKKWKILLIEAGGTENIFHQVPALAAFMQGTDSNWGYKSVPQNVSCFGMNNNECALPRGKIIGGTSSINYMIYNRGNRRDFDRWAEAGCTGWSYNEILPYFKKSERASLNGLEKSNYHGCSGPLNVEYVPYRSKMVHNFIKGCQEAGLKQVDYNGESQIGVSYVQATTKHGHRHSAAKSYIDPILHRQNLHILTRTRAMKVLIEPKTKTAYGVQFSNKGKIYNIRTKNEVILSAGTFNSPQLLMLSGTGPSDHLNNVGITTIQNLPVGEVMYDHLSFPGPVFVINTTRDSLRITDLNVFDLTNFVQGHGRLTSIGGVEALAFIKTQNSIEPADIPDAEIIFSPGSFASDQGTGLKNGANIRNNVYNRFYTKLEHMRNDHFSTIIMQFHPKSHGNVRLRDNNPFHWPIIDPKFLTDEYDIETILNGIKTMIKITKSPSLKKLGIRLYDVPLPGCDHILFGSDDYWRCCIRTLSYTLHHQVATCKMGSENDSTTVVDPQLKVHGIKRLRVADISIVPHSITGHTNAISFVIGEKASDMIKNDWK